MKQNKKKRVHIPTKAENVLRGKAHREATCLFYLCNLFNLLLCFFAFTPLSKINSFLVFILPYLYFLIRIVLYKVWYRLGYHPLPERKHYRNLKGGMDLPVFTKNTEEYVRVRQKQSLKYQVIYNVYKVAYRTSCFSLLFVQFPLLVYIVEKGLRQLSGGNEGIELFLFISLVFMTLLLSYLIYEAGKMFWQGYFYKRYPVKVLLIERDEPIFTEVS